MLAFFLGEEEGLGSEAGQQTANKCGVTTALVTLCMVCKGHSLCLGYQLCSNDMRQSTKLCKHLVCKQVFVNIVQSWPDLGQPSCSLNGGLALSQSR